MATPSSFAVAIQRSIADSALAMALGLVFPWAMQPGNSGTSTTNRPLPSMATLPDTPARAALADAIVYVMERVS